MSASSKKQLVTKHIRRAYQQPLDSFQVVMVDKELRSFLNIGLVLPLSLPAILGSGITGMKTVIEPKQRERGRDTKKNLGGDATGKNNPKWFMENPKIQ